MFRFALDRLPGQIISRLIQFVQMADEHQSRVETKARCEEEHHRERVGHLSRLSQTGPGPRIGELISGIKVPVRGSNIPLKAEELARNKVNPEHPMTTLDDQSSDVGPTRQQRLIELNKGMLPAPFINPFGPPPKDVVAPRPMKLRTLAGAPVETFNPSARNILLAQLQAARTQQPNLFGCPSEITTSEISITDT
jgi:hypothetical protein